MSGPLTPEQERDLVGFLCYWFGRAELEDVAFELGAGLDLFAARPKQDLAQALVRFFQRVGRLGCLVDEVRRRAPEGDLPPLPEPLPACVVHRKVELVLPGPWERLRLPKLRRALARSYKVPADQVVLVGAAGDGIRLLFSLPDTRPFEPGTLDLRRYRGGSLRSFEELDGIDRRVWRAVACRYPVERRVDGLHPVVAWDVLRRALVRKRMGTAVCGVGLAAAALVASYAGLWPRLPVARAAVQTMLTRVTGVALAWGEFFWSIALSLVGLIWLTVLLFAGLALVLRALPRLLHVAVSQYPSRVGLSRVRDRLLALLGGHERVVGTCLNVLASASALSLFAWVTGQPLDYWDLGIQCGIALLIELVVLGVILRVHPASPALS